MPKRSHKPRVFRDPVHDIIDLRCDPRLGAVVCALIDTPEVQRLRFVRQLGLAHLVFHGAEHSRFSHSLGVAHVALRMCDRLRDAIDADARLATVCAALLHDIGHAPFSHVMERVFAFHHEALSAAIVRDADTEVHRTLAAVDPALPERVAALLSGESDPISGHIVSSQLDADRADYLLRDAHMTGVGVGRYDLERILLMLGSDDHGLVVESGGFEAVEGYLVARYHMYRLIYFHRVVRAAEAMVELAFGRAAELMANGDREVAPVGALGSLMRREPLEPGAYTRLGEYSAWSLIDRWRDHRDPILAGLADGLMNRRLFASIERHPDPHGGGWVAEEELVASVREQLSPNERWYFFADAARDVPYRPYVPGDGARKSIRVRDRDGHVDHIERCSHLARALADATYQLRRWYHHPSLSTKLRRILDERGGDSGPTPG